MTETPERATRVRFAELCDLDQILFLCREMHAENGLFAISEDKVHEMVMTHFNRTGGLIGVIGEPGALEAVIGLRISQASWYTDEVVLEDFMTFVLPEFRRSTNAQDLIEFSKKCAKVIGIPLLTGVVSNSRTAAKVNLYRRKFGDPAGAYFLAHVNQD